MGRAPVGRAKKSLGQHFLQDYGIIHRIIKEAAISPEDTVIEIGPGEGCLTFPLALAARRVIAIELDASLVGPLRERGIGYPALEVICADALTYPLETIAGPFKVVANIPYYITTPLLFHLLEYRDRIASMILMVQREVAERMAAFPGGKDYGLLSVTTQFHVRTEICFPVPREAFFPVPEVESAVVRLVPHASPPVSLRDEAFFFQLVRTAFSHRRKTLPNALHSPPHFSRDAVRRALDRMDIDPRRRPETLSLPEWGKLSDILFEFRHETC
jgi:16S rRNA (adenine1518-N6/adenine1519-N6)-dimethyltransferase